MQKFLGRLDCPASKQDFVKRAEQEGGADENVRSTLEQLPDGDYETPTDVSKGYRQGRVGLGLPISRAGS